MSAVIHRASTEKLTTGRGMVFPCSVSEDHNDLLVPGWTEGMAGAEGKAEAAVQISAWQTAVSAGCLVAFLGQTASQLGLDHTRRFNRYCDRSTGADELTIRPDLQAMPAPVRVAVRKAWRQCRNQTDANQLLPWDDGNPQKYGNDVGMFFMLMQRVSEAGNRGESINQTLVFVKLHWM